MLNSIEIVFLVICRTLEVKEHLTTVLEVRVGKPQRDSIEALIFHRDITKNLCTSVKCDQF